MSGSASGPAVDHEIQSAVARLDNHLVIDGDGMVRCERCGHALGPVTENYKLHAVRKDRPIEDANPRIVDPGRFIDQQVVFRQYFCPGCAVALENEVILEDSDPVWDKQLDSGAGPDADRTQALREEIRRERLS